MPTTTQARRIWNAAIDRHPGLIVRCRGTADVIAGGELRPRQRPPRRGARRRPQRRRPRALRRRPRDRPLRHARASSSIPAARTVRVQGGATLGDVDRETHLHGLAVPAGVVSRDRHRRPDARRRRRLAGAQVRADLRQPARPASWSPPTAASSTASADEHPDLFWALQGGGGNFGIVTAFPFRAHPVSTRARRPAGLAARPGRRASCASTATSWRRAPEELTAYCALVTTPDGHAGLSSSSPAGAATSPRASVSLAPLRAFGPPVADTIQPMPFPAMQQIARRRLPGRHPQLLELELRARPDRRGHRHHRRARQPHGARRCRRR